MIDDTESSRGAGVSVRFPGEAPPTPHHPLDLPYAPAALSRVGYQLRLPQCPRSSYRTAVNRSCVLHVQRGRDQVPVFDATASLEPRSVQPSARPDPPLEQVDRQRSSPRQRWSRKPPRDRGKALARDVKVLDLFAIRRNRDEAEVHL